MTPSPFYVLLLSVVFHAGSVHATVAESGQQWDRETALRYSQQALRRTVGDRPLTDREGKPVSVGDFRGKPLVVSFIYTSCYHFCPMLTSHLANVVGIANEALGSDRFAVITVGFDSPVDSPERMQSFARSRGIEFPNWSFLSADAETIEAFTADLGFVYFPSPKGFDHLAQTTVLDAGGRVYRQIYGADFDAPRLVEPLKELLVSGPVWSSGIGDWVSGIRLFCTVYDPKSGRYRFDYSIVVAFGIGALCLAGLAIFVVHAWKGHEREKV
jgi:protein SCO1/2